MIRAFVIGLAIALVGCTTDVTPFDDRQHAFVIRHFEKEAGEDPGLTAQGKTRADKLAKMLEGRKIVAIYSTPTRRTMDSVRPLADRLGLKITPYRPTPGDHAALAQAVGMSSGDTVIVGHSNTVPEIIRRLGGPDVGTIDEKTGYGTLYVFTSGGGFATYMVE